MQPLKVLTVAIAQQFIEAPRSINLKSFEVIEDEAARMLATHNA